MEPPLPEALAVQEGDSFDEICDQIRMLRASVVPGGLGRNFRSAFESPNRAPPQYHHPCPGSNPQPLAPPQPQPGFGAGFSGPRVVGGFGAGGVGGAGAGDFEFVGGGGGVGGVGAQGPSSSAETIPVTPPVVYRMEPLAQAPAAYPAQVLEPVAASPIRPLSGSPGTGPGPRPGFGPGQYSPAGPPTFAGPTNDDGRLGHFGPACLSPRPPPPPRAYRLTLWQEQQLDAAFQAWKSLLAQDAPPDDDYSLPSTDARPMELGRGDGGMRLQAEELARSVELLRTQVRARLKAGLQRWHRGAQMRARQRATLQACVCRSSLRHWKQQAALHSGLRKANTEFESFCRTRQLRLGLRFWSESSQRSREEQDKARSRKASLKAASTRWALRRWFAYLRGPGRCRKILAERLQAEEGSEYRDVFRQLARHAEFRRREAREESNCSRHMQDFANSAMLKWWHRWSRRRRHHAQLLLRHDRNHVRPRLQRSLFLRWAAVVRREQRQISTLHRARAVLTLSSKSRTFQAWQLAARSKAQGSLKLRLLHARLSTHLLARCVGMWHLWAAFERHINQTIRQRHLQQDRSYLTLFFGRLRHYRDYSLEKKRLLTTATGLSNSHVARRRLTTWRHEATRLRNQRGAVDHSYDRSIKRNLQRCLVWWHVEAAEVVRERTMQGRSQSYRHLKVLRRGFDTYRQACKAQRREDRNEGVAGPRRAQVLRSTAFRAWHTYLWRRRGQRHTQERTAVLRHLTSERQRRFLERWATARTGLKAGLLSQKGTLGRALMAWLAYRQKRIDERRAHRRVQAIRSKNRCLISLRAWNQLRAAHAVHRTHGERQLVRRALDAWLEVQYGLTSRRSELLLRGGELQALRLALYGFRMWWKAILAVRHLRRCIEALAESLQPVLREARLEAYKDTYETWWEWVEEKRLEEDAELLSDCFAAWVQCSNEALHRRSIMLLCSRYRVAHGLRLAIAAWKKGVERSVWLQDTVLMWVAIRATNSVSDLFLVWRALTNRRVRARQAYKEVILLRKENLFAAMRSTSAMYLAFNGVESALQLRLYLKWLIGWRDFVRQQVARKKQDNERTAAVSRLRRSRLFESWRAAGRIVRLGRVASAWECHTTSRELLQAALFAWSAAMALYVRAERVQTRIEGMRARQLLRCWSSLQTALAQRRRILAETVMKGWRRLKDKGHLQIDRLLRFQSHQAKRPFETWLRFAKLWRRQHDAAKTLLGTVLQRDSNAAFRTWRRLAREAARLKRAKDGARRIYQRCDERHLAELTQHLPELWRWWREATYVGRALRFRDRHPRLISDVLGHDIAVEALRLWSGLLKKQRHLEECEDRVRKLVTRRELPRYFSEWVQVYEHVASSYCAAQLLDRWRLARIVEAWHSLAGFRKRLIAHVLEVQRLKDLRNMSKLIRLWRRETDKLLTVRSFWLGQQTQSARRMFLAWVAYLRQRQSLRSSLFELRAGVKSHQARRRAEVLRLASLISLTQRAFEEYAGAVKKAKRLKQRCSNLADTIAEARRHRRLLLWTAHGRASRSVANFLLSVLEAWREAVLQRTIPIRLEKGLRHTPTFFESQTEPGQLLYDREFFGRQTPNQSACFCVG